jgi:precorrin-2 methylase
MAVEELAAKVQAPEEMVATEVNELVVDGRAVVVVSEGNPRVYLNRTR